MKKYLLLFLSLSFFNVNQLAAEAKYIDKLFGDWLVSCKYNDYEEIYDCFLGSQFDDDLGGGSIIFTNYYLAITHNSLNLRSGIKAEIDKRGEIDSSMNTGFNVFFSNDNRAKMMREMMSGENLYLRIPGAPEVLKSLNGFSRAYNFYLTHN